MLKALFGSNVAMTEARGAGAGWLRAAPGAALWVLGALVTAQLLGLGGSTSSYRAGLEQLTLGLGCEDSLGVAKTHLEEWQEGDCDRTICWHGTSFNYTITYSCRDIPDAENPDTTNCEVQSNLTMTFPACCPTLACDLSLESWVYATEAPCLDRSASAACSFWATEGGCGTDHQYYNFTVDYCQLSCGFC